jgi:hypothetical protein
LSTPPNIVGRDEARALGLKRFFTGMECKHGHVAERSVRSCACMECLRKRRARQRAANPEKTRELDREHARRYRAAHPERVRKNWRRWRAANPRDPQKDREYRRLSYAKNKDKLLSQEEAKRARTAREERLTKRRAAQLREDIINKRRAAAQRRAARAAAEVNGAGLASS